MAHVARDLGITAGCLRTWVAQADIDEGRRPGVTSAERANLVALRRARRVSEMDDEIRRKVAVYFARRDLVPQ